MREKPELSSIKDVILAVSQEQSPNAALGELLSGVVSVTKSVVGKLYLLSLRDSCYRVEFDDIRAETKQSLPSIISLADLESVTPEDPISQAIQSITSSPKLSQQDQGTARILSGLLVSPIIRNASLLGLMIFDRGSVDAFTSKDIQTAETAAAIIIMLLEKRATLDLLQSIQHPIDFLLPLDDFLNRLLGLVKDATGMRYVALRELQPDGKTLKCLSVFGFQGPDKSDFDLTDIERYPTFDNAIKYEITQAEPTIDALHLETVRQRPEFSLVRSFVVTPIKVGNGIFGTLSFAAECEYNYSPLELAGFEAIANSLGIAISNNRNVERANEILVETATVGISFTGIEVAQAARHEARGVIDNAQLLLTHLSARVSSGKQDKDAITKLIDDIGDSLQTISDAIDKIRVATLVPKMVLQTVSIRELWNQALVTISGRTREENVHPAISGDAQITVYPELLRMAFLNLVLNSLDAFREWGKKSSRKITINIDQRAEDAQQIKIRYYDNAGGIDPTRLTIPSLVKKSQKSQNPLDVIFELGVTSKKNGSGYGLYLVRRIIDDHHGSIELVDYRGGVTFDIYLPKHQTVSAQTSKN